MNTEFSTVVKASVIGDHNIILQDINGSSIEINVNNPIEVQKVYDLIKIQFDNVIKILTQKLDDIVMTRFYSDIYKKKYNLYIADIDVDCLRNDNTCLLDFKFQNTGRENVTITKIKFSVLSVEAEIVLGEIPPSKEYDIDISNLKKKGDSIEKGLFHFIETGKPDRFLFKVSANKMQINEFRKWSLLVEFTTNFGILTKEPITIFLPWDLDKSSNQPK